MRNRASLAVLAAGLITAGGGAARAQSMPAGAPGRDAPVQSLPAAATAPADAGPAAAALQSQLHVTAAAARTWAQGDSSIVTLAGPVRITTGDATMTADEAVLWLDPPTDGSGGYRVGIALVGGAALTQSQGVTREGETLYVTATAAGDAVQIEARQRVAQDDRASPLFQRAAALRSATAHPTAVIQSPATQRVVQGPTFAGIRPATEPTPVIRQPSTDDIHATWDDAQLIPNSSPPAYALLHPVVLLKAADGDTFELRGERAVVFTRPSAKAPAAGGAATSMAAMSPEDIYLEGDVRIVYTPPQLQYAVRSPTPGRKSNLNEQRVTASAAYFRVPTRTVVLTKVVLHSSDVESGQPIVIRAKLMKAALREGSFDATDARFTQSAFAAPSYDLQAGRIYIRSSQRERATTTQPAEAAHTTFTADDVAFHFFGVPLFYLPHAAGDVSSGKGPLRILGVGQNTRFGTEFLTGWGLFETLGKVPPQGVDATYRVDYLTDRGPAIGLDGKYVGDSITETDHQPIGFDGKFESYFVYDHGIDQLGGSRLKPGDEVAGGPKGERFQQYPDDDNLRGYATLQHQYFFPDGWQLQARGSYVSDSNFLEEYFWKEFDGGLPKDDELYVKHMQDNEAFSLLVNAQPNRVVTTSDAQQEQFEIEHLPEVDYHRNGDALLGDGATFQTDDSVAGLHYQLDRASLRQQGFDPTTADKPLDQQILPGIPSVGTSGTTGQAVWRGDFRQELDFPFEAGNFKVVPYVLGRYTAYSDSPEDTTKNRALGGVGARVSTAFWKVDDSVDSDLFDIHRVRHVIEPELNLFAAISDVRQNELYIYDESIDAINDIRAIQMAFRQRWQTKRGGPGRWRSVDFLTLNVEADLFAHQPKPDAADPYVREPADFRGVYFPSEPEASIPRNAINVNGNWRVSDSTVVLGDLDYNLDYTTLATASIGVAVNRDDRMSYYLGTRYIADLNSNITTFDINYQLSSKYQVSFSQSFDFSQGHDVGTSFAIQRHLDRFFAELHINYDETNHESSVGVNFSPEGFGGSTDQVGNLFASNR